MAILWSAMFSGDSRAALTGLALRGPGIRDVRCHRAASSFRRRRLGLFLGAVLRAARGGIRDRFPPGFIPIFEIDTLGLNGDPHGA